LAFLYERKARDNPFEEIESDTDHHDIENVEGLVQNVSLQNDISTFFRENSKIQITLAICRRNLDAITTAANSRASALPVH
jgi:hypothetical protein